MSPMPSSTVEIFEALMLICFSISWYWSIAKMLMLRIAVGKSVAFVALICAGYVAGIVSKLAEYDLTGELSPLIWLYIWNGIVVAVDLVLVVYFSRPRPVDVA